MSPKQKDELHCLTTISGADGYLAKPFSAEKRCERFVPTWHPEGPALRGNSSTKG